MMALSDEARRLRSNTTCIGTLPVTLHPERHAETRGAALTALQFLVGLGWGQGSGVRGQRSSPGNERVCLLQGGGVQLKQRGDVVAVRHGDEHEVDLVGRLALPLGEQRLRLALVQKQEPGWRGRSQSFGIVQRQILFHYTCRPATSNI